MSGVIGASTPDHNRLSIPRQHLRILRSGGAPRSMWVESIPLIQECSLSAFEDNLMIFKFHIVIRLEFEERRILRHLTHHRISISPRNRSTHDPLINQPLRVLDDLHCQYIRSRQITDHHRVLGFQRISDCLSESDTDRSVLSCASCRFQHSVRGLV